MIDDQTERTGMNLDASVRLFALGTETGKRGYRWCYIAGPMRGKVNWNYEAFNEAAKTLRDYDWHVFNPAETDAEVRDAAEKAPNPLSVYMQQDLVDVCKSDVVFVLEDWRDSEGARLEVYVAENLGKPVYTFPQIEKIGPADDPAPYSDAVRDAIVSAKARVLDHVTPAGDPVTRKATAKDLPGTMHVSELNMSVDEQVAKLQEKWDAEHERDLLKTTKHFDHEKGHLVDSRPPIQVPPEDRPGPVFVSPDDNGFPASFPTKLIYSKSPNGHYPSVPIAAEIRQPVRPTMENVTEATARLFSSGATRNPDTNKPDYEGFNSPLVMEAFGRYMHAHRKQGKELRSSDNWQKGIPLPEYMKSLWRHFLHVWLLHRGHEALDPDTGEPVTLEDALCGVLFNSNGYLHELLKGVDTVTLSG